MSMHLGGLHGIGRELSSPTPSAEARALAPLATVRRRLEAAAAWVDAERRRRAAERAWEAEAQRLTWWRSQ